MKPENIPATVYHFEQVSRPMLEEPAGLREYMRTRVGTVLQQAGLTNDTCFFVNRARRKAGLGVSDTITLRLNCGPELGWALLFNFEKLVKTTRAVEVEFNVPRGDHIWDSVECGSSDMPVPLDISISKS